MMSRRVTFRQADVTRALRAALAVDAGLRVEIAPDGTIRIVRHEPTPKQPVPDQDQTPLAYDQDFRL